ncbi:MAG: AAA family ATPase [Clostridiales bacterium]|nr:AAA family ATPase [Clostridiales bacterium]
MLKFIDDKTLEGVIPSSDCGENLRWRWIERCTNSFYIRDADSEKRKVAAFITGEHKCKIDSASFFQYLDDVEEIARKFKHLYFGPLDVLSKCKQYFLSKREDERYILISYRYPDRYLKLSDNIYSVYLFRRTLIANIANLRIEKSQTGEYTLFVNLIENWRSEIMAYSSKCGVDAAVSIFNSHMDVEIKNGKSKQIAACSFGILYAPLLKNNHINVSAMLNDSRYAGDNLLDAVKAGIEMSPDILWESKPQIAEDCVDDNNEEEYIKFKKLLEWFVKQLNINNGVEQGERAFGQGYKDTAKLRKLYAQWREYNGFELDCNFNPMNTRSPRTNYINYKSRNIRPIFEKDTNTVVGLYIDLFYTDESAACFAETMSEKYGNEYTVKALGLFDGKEPNDELKKLFDDFIKFLAEVDVYYSQSGVVVKPLDISSIVRTKRTAANQINELNLILYGPPGTGKTYSTTEYAVAAIENREPRQEVPASEYARLVDKYRALVKNGQIVFTTFHQNYGYEDFIQGLRPESKDGVMNFVPKNGIFKMLAEKAITDKENNYVIIIDEINRGNISKIFGELITLIEEDKRWGEENQMCLKLPGGGEFAVPNNLYIIGTMNSADKSIALIDTALRRRFDFIEVSPNSSFVGDTTLRNVLDALNKELRARLDSSDLLIGHAYFINKSENDLAVIMNRKIIPLLYEYFYDQTKKVEEVVNKVLTGTAVKIDDTNKHGRIRVK